MKAFLIIILLAAAGYCGYQYYMGNGDAVKITGSLQVSHQSNFNINAPQVSGPLYVATVHGTAVNTSGKLLKNIYIRYKIAGEITSATIFDLAPGQQIEFTTKSVKTRGKNPSFSLEAVQFEESD